MEIKIRHKLFLTLLVSSALVSGGLFFFLQWNFDRGFLNYVKKQELEQLTLLSKELVELYNGRFRQQGWDMLRDNHRLWITLNHRMGSDRDQKPLPRKPPGKVSHPGPMLDTSGPDVRTVDFRNIGPRIMLFDKEKKWVIGAPPELIENGQVENLSLKKYPIYSDEKVIGYLSLIPLSELSHSGDLLFVEEQTNAFMMVALIMLLGSIILTFPLTVHLLKPIKRLTKGTQNLIRGKFSTRIPVQTSDELGTLSDHFNILARTLEKNEHARKQWVADISHELRTPLSVLRGGVEAIQDGIRKPDEQNLDVIHDEIIHLERLVSDLYELSMSDIGALTYKKSSLIVTDVLQSVIEQYDARFVEKGVEVRVTLDENRRRGLLGDPDRIQQLFVNLLENSLKYTEAPGRLQISSVCKDNMLVILFEDTAPGATSEQLPFLFERLYRTDASRNREQYGAGLGLTIAKNIVEAHDGNISADHSDLGGLRICVELPVK